ncbi:AAA family ATPase [Winogradskyella sp.]|uniref:AAA family ATPase n=1 Tax=Winogradskyella sp. TaxID=1883156 RepID=UPI00260E1A1D|nr:ATP-binding protein [Winogradskyella sp.]
MNEGAVYIAEIEKLNFKNFENVNGITFLKNDMSIYPWTIFLGNNGTGKTNILKALSCLESEEESGILDREGKEEIFYLSKGLSENHEIKALALFDNSLFELETEQHNDRGSRRILRNKKFKDFIIYAYGVNRRSSKEIKLSTQEDVGNNETLFNPDFTLINLNEWLLQTDYAVKNGQKTAKKRLDLIKSVITGEIFPELQDFKFHTSERLNNYVEFKTNEGWFRFEDLAYGYQSTLSWIIDFCKKMFDRYPNSQNPLKEPAVVLIDEIDLHLHPEWQRNITQILSNLFPKTQFIATTHSPLVVQSLQEANVYVLVKEKNSTNVSISRMPNKSFKGWSVEEILNKVMGLKSKVKSDLYLELINQFDEGLDKADFEKSKEAFDKLMDILPDSDSQKRVLQMQIKQFPEVR